MRPETPSAPTSKPPGLVFPVQFGRDIVGDLGAAEQREWLITNGIGGYASGTLAGLLTRRYHGLLIAALKPPLGRTLLVAKLEETTEYDGRSYSLSVNRWSSGAVDPQGFRYIERFRLEGTTPVWTYACADALVEKRIWMQRGANTTYVRYCLARGSRPLRLTLRALVNYRDHHFTTLGADWRMEIAPVGCGLRVLPLSGATPFYLFSAKAEASPEHTWYRDFELAAERERGLEDKEDHLHAGTFRATLGPGESVTIVLSTDSASNLDGERAWEERAAYDRELVAAWADANPAIAENAPAWIPQLVLAADQFVVDRKSPDHPDGKTVIAGYHWFEDWGRDTMIALGGLTLATGRPQIARSILRTFASFVDRGMLPNRFQEKGDAPEYNTVDAALWFFEAIRQYFAATSDLEFLREVYPVLVDSVEWHVRGTRYVIHVDRTDGLLYAGEPGVQLTWMDAKVGDWVVTPRIGKPIEVNALWLNAVATMGDFSRVLRRPSAKFESLAAKAQAGFERFWNDDLGYCYDVLDGPEGNDATLRPNQIFAVALSASALSPEQQKAVVDTCSRFLLTSHGLRTLSPADPHYQGHYGGPPRARDAAYHQGTVWGWLLGPFVRAYLRVYKDAASALSFLAPMEHHLKVHGLGTAAEIFDGDAPFVPRGCIAQAWTVAEVLSAWQEVAAWAKAHPGSAAL